MRIIRLLAVAAVLGGMTFTLAGCDPDPLSYTELGPGATTYLGGTGIDRPAVRDRAMETGRPSTVWCWHTTIGAPGLYRHTLIDGALYTMYHGIAWCEDGTNITDVYMNFAGYTIHDDLPIVSGVGGIRQNSPCTSTDPNSVPVGHPTAHVQASCYFVYSIVQATGAFTNVRYFNPRTDVDLHAHDSTHGGLSYFTGTAWNG